MSENLSLDETIAKLKAEAQETLKKVILENKQRFEAGLVSRQQHLIEKLNPNLIKFNVGGYKFVTTLDTLSKIKDTKLHKMATGRYPITLDAKNRIFVDRNGQYFGYVLDCLRKGKVELPTSDSFLLSRVQREYEFFELISVGPSSNSSSSSCQKEETKVNNNLMLKPQASAFGISKTVSPGFGSFAAVSPFQQQQQQPMPVPFNAKPIGFGSQLPVLPTKTHIFQPQIFQTHPGGFGAKPASFGTQMLPTISKPISFIQENYAWRFSSQIEGDMGVGSGLDRIKIEATELEGQTIGDTLLTSGTHQWRFLVEELFPIKPSNLIEDDIFCEGIVTFGVVTKQMWKKLKKSGDFYLACGFNTIGETFKADVGSKKNKGLKVDGPDQITEIGCKNQEIKLTFNTQSGVLKLTCKSQDGQEKNHMLRINESAGNEYYPYFHLSDARVQLLETKELSKSEIQGMDFILEKTEYDDLDDESDYEDVDSDEAEESL